MGYEVGDKFIVEIDSKIGNGNSYGYGLKDLPVIIREADLDCISKYDLESQEKIIRKSTLNTINKVFAIAPNRGFFNGENPETIIYDYAYSEIIDELRAYKGYLIGLYKQYYSEYLNISDTTGQIIKIEDVAKFKVDCTIGRTAVSVLGSADNKAKINKLYVGSKYILDGAGVSRDTWKKYAGYEEREKGDPFDTEVYRLIFVEASCEADAFLREVEQINKMPF